MVGSYLRWSGPGATAARTPHLPDERLPVVVKDGWFGAYVTEARNATLRKGDEVETIAPKRRTSENGDDREALTARSWRVRSTHISRSHQPRLHVGGGPWATSSRHSPCRSKSPEARHAKHGEPSLQES